MSPTLISIIIPAFNVEKYISKTLESVRSQSRQDWEIIVINDGGIDGTAELVSKFARSVPQKVLLLEHSQSLGPSAARNTGMKATIGEYIAFLDADDFWTPDHLENAVKVLADGTADLVYADACVFRETTVGAIEKLPIDTFQVTSPAKDLFRRNFANTSGVLITRRLMEKIGNYDETLWAGEEWDYWIRAATMGFKIIGTERQTYYYRKSDNSLSAASARMAESAARIYEKHRHCAILPESEIMAKAAGCYFAAGKLYWRNNPHAASQNFYKAWRLQKYHLKPALWLGFTSCLKFMSGKKETASAP